MEEIRLIEQQFRNQQERLTYYLIGLSVAAIGFSIHLTYGEPFKWIQLPLGLSLISFGISILCGFKYLRKLLEILSHNKTYLYDKKKGLGGAEEEYILGKISKVQISAGNYRTCLGTFFIIGIGLFLVWHLMEMYIMTI
jgi:hypothetical protein